MNRDAVRNAYKYAEKQGMMPVLVGTAALALLGYAVEPPDFDFLTNEPGREKDYGGPPGPRFDGCLAQYIRVGDPGPAEFYHPERANMVDGVRVAALQDIIGLKRWRNRDKDREFLRGWDAWANRIGTR